MKKNIFLSKTLWLNIAALAATYGNLLPPKYSVPTLAIANIAVRLLTTQGVTLGPSEPR